MSVEAMSAVFCAPVGSMTQNERMVLTVFANYANQQTCVAWPSFDTVAGKAATTVRSVQRAVKSLETKGFLTRIAEANCGRKTAQFRIEITALDPRHRVTPDTESPVTNEALTPDTVSLTPDTVSPKPRITNITPKPSKRGCAQANEDLGVLDR